MRSLCIRVSRLAAFVLTAVGLVPTDAHAAGLVLWNRLGSDAEILNSAHGPALQFYGGGTWPDVTGVAAYAPGVFGGALTIGPFGYGVYDRVHTVISPNVDRYLSAEHGTVELWFKQLSTPVDYVNGIYRLFDGGFGRNSGIGLQSLAGGLTFDVHFGGTTTSVQYPISGLNGSWIHVAGVWDRTGIDGSADTVRLYVDGAVVASSTEPSWGTTVGVEADIAGANDNDIAGQFFQDNLKVYDFAMTDFTHRFEEDWIVPEPQSLALLVLLAAALPQARRRRRRSR
jgi:hypothetical protein